MSNAPISTTPILLNAERPLLPPRASHIIFCSVAALVVFCLMLPRALSFLPSVLGAAGVAIYYARYKIWPRFDRTIFILICTLIALGGMSALWSVDPAYSFGRFVKNAFVILPALGLLAAAGVMAPAHDSVKKILSLVIIVCALAGAGLFFEYHSNFLLSRHALGYGAAVNDDNLPDSIHSEFLFNRSNIFLVLISMPLGLALLKSDIERRKKIALAALLYGCIGAALIATKSQTAQFSALLAVLMAVYPGQIKFFRRLVMLGTLLALFASPFVMIPAYNAFFASPESRDGGIVHEASVPHRLEVWKFVSEEILKRPLLGHGLDTTRFLRADYIMKNMNTDRVLHPHNAILEIWEEFGLVGIIVAAALAVCVLREIDLLPDALLRRYFTMLYVVMLSVLMMGYGLWQPWLLGLIIAIPAFSRMMISLYPSVSKDLETLA